MKIPDNNWRFVVHVPEKIPFLETHQVEIITDQDGKPVAREYHYDPFQYIQAMRAYHKISKYRDVYYFIRRGNALLNDHYEGHLCFLFSHENNNGKRFDQCDHYTYGRTTLGCKQIPIYDTSIPWGIRRAAQAIVVKREFFWFQIGAREGGEWRINKPALKRIAIDRAVPLESCPLFCVKPILERIDELPDFIQMSDPSFKFHRMRDDLEKVIVTAGAFVPTHIVIRRC